MHGQKNVKKLQSFICKILSIVGIKNLKNKITENLGLLGL